MKFSEILTGAQKVRMTMEERRSMVRVLVTRWASVYIFGGSAILIAALWFESIDVSKLAIAKDIYMSTLPIAAGVISYWFATRANSSQKVQDQSQSGETDPK